MLTLFSVTKGFVRITSEATCNCTTRIYTRSNASLKPTTLLFLSFIVPFVQIRTTTELSRSLPSSMEHALSRPEIVQIIAHNADSRTIVACARVSKMWSDIALDEIWHTIRIPDHLLAIAVPWALPLKDKSKDECVGVEEVNYNSIFLLAFNCLQSCSLSSHPASHSGLLISESLILS